MNQLHPESGIRAVRTLALAAATVLLSACAALQPGDPVQVTVSGIEPLPGDGLELRLLVKLRVQNPNDTPISFDGVALTLEVQDRVFATGVSDELGTVPRFGESVIAIPVTVSAMRMIRQLMGVADGQAVDQVSYVLRGKLNGAAFRAVRFESTGELALPSVAGAAPRR